MGNKYSIFLFILFILPITLSAQKSGAEKMFEKYSGKPCFMAVNVTPEMFSIFEDISKEEQDQLAEALKNVETIKIVSYSAGKCSGKDAERGEEFYKELVNYPISDYKVLMEINDGDRKSKMLVKRNDKIIKEFLMLNAGKNESLMIWITGELDLKAISTISETVKTQGLK
jgi:hypothetical protein